MRALKLLTAAAATVLVAGCAGDDWDRGPVEPNVTFRYDQAIGFPTVAERADDWCEDNHGMTAYTYETEKLSDGYAATFTCG